MPGSTITPRIFCSTTTASAPQCPSATDSGRPSPLPTSFLILSDLIRRPPCPSNPLSPPLPYPSLRLLVPPAVGHGRGASFDVSTACTSLSVPRSRAKFTAASSIPAPPSTTRHFPFHLLHRLDKQQHGLSATCTRTKASACSSGERIQSVQSVLSHRMRVPDQLTRAAGLNPPHPYCMRAYDPSTYAGGAHVERANGGVRLVLRVWERGVHWECEYDWIKGG
ncbi:hypothetical protein C8F04DRAFT_1267204 [Mycena alexandri]|uniref:Uncharacterized protein n=1 Tax=Mycena alexandri TaxID=1745969 RepID=A0AAD6WWI3_9AGAR|nr:hypothetical protein C8F04DRAFT_1267204 [Mycena alexandri]